MVLSQEKSFPEVFLNDLHKFDFFDTFVTQI
jgi:hypothetical protein